MTICQTKNLKNLNICIIIFSSIFFGCAKLEVKEDHRPRIIPNWLRDVDEKYDVKDEKGKAYIHPFFDIDPRLQSFTDDDSNGFVNYIPLTPRDSQYRYEINLQNGKLFKQKTYCSLEDGWKNYKGKITTPNIQQGILPRVLDKNKRPYEIFIVSDNKYLSEFSLKPQRISSAKIIGSLLIEKCSKYLCLDKEDWEQDQILIGLSSLDPLTESTNTIEKLNYLLNWDYLKAFVENNSGVSFINGKPHPKTKLIKFYTIENTHKYFYQNSSILSDNRMDVLKGWRNSCYAMYDSFYEKTLAIRKENKPEVRFFEFFKEFYNEKMGPFKECLNLVSPSNVLNDIDRHWFFAHIQGFIKLSDAGYYYHCNNGAWSYNPRHADGSYYVDQKVEFRRCRPERFEKMFESIKNGFELMRSTERKTYKYIEFDNKAGGSYEMLYTWIYDDSQQLNCTDKKSMGHQTSEDIFPNDVRWKRFQQSVETLIR